MILSRLIDFVFPKRCIGCKESGDYLCGKCISELLKLKGGGTCANCRRRQPEGKFCSGKCAEKFYFEQLIAYSEYRGNLLKKLVIKFKYGFIKDLAQLLGALLCECIKSGFKDFVLVFVPANRSRLNYRGYNQAFLLAEVISENTGLILCDCLKRNSDLKQQAKLTKSERVENAKDSVVLKAEYGDFLKGKKILLVDDIATTCQTLNECSRVLKTAGAKYICALVLARKW